MEFDNETAFAMMNGIDPFSRPRAPRAAPVAAPRAAPVAGFSGPQVESIVRQAVAQATSALRAGIAQRDAEIDALRRRIAAMQGDATAVTGAPPRVPDVVYAPRSPFPTDAAPSMTRVAVRDAEPDVMDAQLVDGPGPESPPMTADEAALFYGGEDEDD